jgi:hypothetical protein
MGAGLAPDLGVFGRAGFRYVNGQKEKKKKKKNTPSRMFFEPSFFFSFDLHLLCVVAGLREQRLLHLEARAPYFPVDYVQTAAGRAHAETLAATLREKHERYPRAKRKNYEQLGFASPFAPDVQGVLGPGVDPGTWWSVRMDSPAVDAIVRELAAGRIVVAAAAEQIARTMDAPTVDGGVVFVRVLACGRGVPTRASPLYIVSEAALAYWKSRVTVAGAADAPPRAKLRNNGARIPGVVDVFADMEHDLDQGQLPAAVVAPPLDAAAVMGYVTTGAFVYDEARGAAVAVCGLVKYLESVERCARQVVEVFSFFLVIPVNAHTQLIHGHFFLVFIPSLFLQ